MAPNQYFLMNEADDGTGGAGGGGGGEADLTIDIAAASEQIGSELGLGDDETNKDLDAGSATPPGEKKPAAGPTGETPELKAAREARERAAAAATPEAKALAAKTLTDAKAALTAKKVDFTGKTDAEILELAKPASANAKPLPKSWKKELGEVWNKLPVEAQDYIDQREAQVAEGFKANANAVRYAEAIYKTMEPHQALLSSQGIKNHVEFVNSLVNAHYVLSSQPDTARYPYIAQILASYGLDPVKVGEAFTALPAKGATVAKTAETVALEQRMAKMEAERKEETTARFEALKAQTAAEIAAFAADPAHPYFDEVASHVSLLLADPRITLDQAYEQAVYANPITRAKELARISKETTEKTQKEADAAAAAAKKALGTRVRGEERHRKSPDLLGSMEDTMRKTFREIQTRQE